MKSSAERREQAERALLAAGTDSYDSQQFAELGEVREALRAVVQTLREMGFTAVSGSSGYRVNPALRAMRDAVRKAAFAAPVVVVYYTGHGVYPDQDHYYLVGKKSLPADYAGTALPASELLTQLTRRDDDGYPLADQPQVLVILDCCYSGSAGMEMLGEALRGIGNRNTWVIASAGTLEYAQQGLFAKAFCDALERPAIGPSQRFIGLDSLVQAVNDANTGRAEQQARVFPPPTGSTGIPPFFLNKGFVPGLAGLTVDEQHWLSRVRGGPEETTAGWYLTGKEGRTLAAQHLVNWMTNPRPRGLAVVTGSPGTGKSTLLSLPVLLTQLSRRKDLLRTAGVSSLIQQTADLLPADTPLVALHVRGLNTNQAAGLVAQALGRDADSADALLADLDARPMREDLVVVVDAADEATSPATLLGGFVAPLSRQPRVRVVVGARRHVLADVTEADLTVDLDSGQYRDPQALTDYVHRLLVADQEPGVITPYQQNPGEAAPADTAQIAAAIAGKATSKNAGAESFLLGRLFALSARGRTEPVDVTSADWHAELPGSIAEAFDEDLARLDGKRPLAQALLAALAWAKGPGLPWEAIWAPIAETIAGVNNNNGLPITRKDVEWLLTRAGAYIVEDRGPGERSVYRPFHDLLATHLRGEPTTEQRQADPAVAAAWEQRRRRTEGAITRALLGSVATGPTGQPDWQVAHPYLRTYLAQHAAAAGTQVLAELVQDMGFLAVADPLTLTPLLLPTTPKLRKSARVYRRARPQFEDDPRANVAYLLEAAWVTVGAAVPRAVGDLRPRYRTQFAIVRQDESLLTLTGHTSGVTSVAFGTTADGQLLLASASDDKTVRLWDPTTGTHIREPLAGHTSGVTSVAFGATADGQLLLASASSNEEVGLWDPTTGAFLRHLETASEYLSVISVEYFGVISVAFGRTASGRVLLAASNHYGTVKIWDTAKTSRSRVTKIRGWNSDSIAFGGTAKQQLLLATASTDGTVELWHPVAGTAAGRPLTGHAGGVASVAFATTTDEQTLLASASDDGTIRIWDPSLRTFGAGRVTDHPGRVKSVAFGGTTDGQLLLASASGDGRVWLWDPVVGTRAAGPITGHTGGVTSVAFDAIAEGGLLLASGSDDGKVWLWNPLTGARIRESLTGHTSGVTSVAFGTTADGQLLLASGSNDQSVRLWDVTANSAAVALIGHTDAVTSVAFGRSANGRLMLASAGMDGTVRLWDPVTATCAAEPLIGHTAGVSTVAFGTTADQGLLVFSAGRDGTLRFWDPVTATSIGEPLTGHTDNVTSLATGITIDGQLLVVSASDDGTVRLWDPASRTQTAKFQRRSRVKSVAAIGPLLAIGDDEGVSVIEPMI